MIDGKVLLTIIGSVVAISIIILVISTMEIISIMPPTDKQNQTISNKTEPIAKLQNNNKIGLVINTPNQSTSLNELSLIYEQAASTGIGRSNAYLFWSHIEPEKNQFNWEQSDILMSFNKNNNLKVTLFFSIINGKTIGPLPDWIGKPPIHKISSEQLVRVLDAILSRYDIIDSVIIAGEVDEHFRYSEQNIPLYNNLFIETYSSIKEKHPNVKIGNLFSLHGIINKNLFHIIDQVEVGDFIAFNYIPTDPLNDIVKTPNQARKDLENALDIVNDRDDDAKVAFFETSWSTSNFVNGNEQDQADFVRTMLDYYSKNEEKIEFITWYRQYDREKEMCVIEQQQQSLTNPDAGINIIDSSILENNEFVIERLEHYICDTGLIDNSGVTKPSWEEFKDGILSLGSETAEDTINATSTSLS